jgi:hypothetical protein
MSTMLSFLFQLPKIVPSLTNSLIDIRKEKKGIVDLFIIIFIYQYENLFLRQTFHEINHFSNQPQNNQFLHFNSIDIT